MQKLTHDNHEMLQDFKKYVRSRKYITPAFEIKTNSYDGTKIWAAERRINMVFIIYVFIIYDFALNILYGLTYQK